MFLAVALVQHSADNMPLWPNRVFNVISCIVVWVLALFVNYWKTHPTSFALSDWWEDDRTRFRRLARRREATSSVGGVPLEPRPCTVQLHDAESVGRGLKVPVTLEQNEQAVRSRGLPDWLVTHLLLVAKATADGGFSKANVKPIVDIVGREPITIKKFVVDFKGAFV